MRDQEIIGLWEAYQQVHSQPQEEVEIENEIEEGFRKIPAGRQREAMMKRAKTLTKKAMVYAGREGEAAGDDRVKMGKINAALRDPKLREEVETDLFDIILEHLVAEGYADTNEAALAIMANMSEEWKQSIVEMSPAMQNLMSKPSNRLDGKKSPAPVVGQPPTSGAAGKLLKKPDTTIR